MPAITRDELYQALSTLPAGYRRTLRDWGRIMSINNAVKGARDETKRGVLIVSLPKPRFVPETGLLMLPIPFAGEKEFLERARKLTEAVNSSADREIMLLENDQIEKLGYPSRVGKYELSANAVISIRVNFRILSDVLISLPDGLSAMKPLESGGDLFEFTLTKNGVLKRKNGIHGENTYNLTEGSRRYKALCALVSSKNHKFIETRGLAEFIGCDPRQLNRTYGELRKQIANHFPGIRANDVIDSKPGSGYRINPRARIVDKP
jgi:hypothetical protein